MIAATLQILALASCAVILVRAEPALNRMGTRTRLPVRVAMHCLTVGAAGQVGAILLFGDIPTLSTVIALVGAAALLACERRLRILCPTPRRTSQ